MLSASLATFAILIPVLSAPLTPRNNYPTLNTTQTLKGLALLNGGRYFGDAVTSSFIGAYPRYKDILDTQFNAITPENEMKWEVIQPTRGVFNFTGMDIIVKEAQATGSLIRGHNFVWHQQTPSYVTNITDPDELKAVLKEHVDTVMGRYAKYMYAVDVINEPLFDNGTYRDSVWYNVLGPDYFGIALDIVHTAAPGVKLYINDYNIETVSPKSLAYSTIARSLLSLGKPLHGIGFESHFIGGQTPKDIPQAMNLFTDQGLQVAITELDVRVGVDARDVGNSTVLAQAATDYATVVNACLGNDYCPGITVWTFIDSLSWIPSTFPGFGAADLYDAQYAPKPALAAVVEAMTKNHAATSGRQ